MSQISPTTAQSPSPAGRAPASVAPAPSQPSTPPRSPDAPASSTATGRLNFATFAPAVALVIALAAIAVIAPDAATAAISRAKAALFSNFSWFYILAASAFVIFMLLLALSRWGDIRLGRQDEAPALPFASWLAMLFATGMGVGLMYFGVAEPLVHKRQIAADAEQAMLYTLFHWGVHAWAIYGVMGLAMAFFAFRFGMPLSIRSAAVGLLGRYASSRAGVAFGAAADICALIVTIFGITTTLGYAAQQLAAGLAAAGVLASASAAEQCAIIVIIIAIACASAISGVGKGLRRLSELNLLLALALLVFVLFCSHPAELLSALSANIGNYLHELVALSFDTFAYAPERREWFNSWTIFYWAWWLSWAPFVGYFIAKISRGRTIREFIFGVLFVPTLFNALWFSVFGGAALAADAVSGGALGAMAAEPERLLFEFLRTLPASGATQIAALVVLTLFFITSADSGIFVLNCLASSNDASAFKRRYSVLWAALLAAVAIALLLAGGLDAILGVTMLVALPFAALLLLLCASLLRALAADEAYFHARVSPGTVYWSGEFWQKRLQALLRQPNRAQIDEFFSSRVLPAMHELAAELVRAGFAASVETSAGGLSGRVGISGAGGGVSGGAAGGGAVGTGAAKGEQFAKLVVKKELAQDFVYGVRGVQKEVAKALADDALLPFEEKVFYEPQTFFADGREGYDVSYLSKQELIVDILKHYERYLSLLQIEHLDIFTRWRHQD